MTCFVIALILTCGAPLALGQASLPLCAVEFEGAQRLQLPLAANERDRVTGLSGRDDVGAGMLFAWGESGVRHLWMKDTRVPLSAAFIGRDGVVQAITHMQPYSLRQHSSPGPILYIVEVARGEFDRLGVKVGARVAIDCPGGEERQATP